MNEENNDRSRRRDVLKTAGIAAAGLFGLSGISTATTAEREYAASMPLSRVLMKAVGDPTVNRAQKRVLGPFTGYILYTDLGRLIYAENEDGQCGAQFHIEDTTGRSGRVVGSLRFDDIPAGGTATLVATATRDVEFVRTVTETERTRLGSLTGVDTETAEIFYSSPIGGYEVHSLDGIDLTVSQSEFDPNAEPTRTLADRDVYYVRPDSAGSLANATVESVDLSREVTAQNQCETWAERCLQSIVICTGCGGVCLSVPVTNIPGVVVCILCVMGCHFIVPLSCLNVLNHCA